MRSTLTLSESATPVNTLTKVAVRYVRAGFGVITVWPLRKNRTCACPLGKACATPGKHPHDNAWQRNAARTPKAVRALLARRPNVHLGVLPPDGCYILDVDPRNGGKLGGAMPRTVAQRSGGGGVHYVVRGDALRGKAGAGLDIKRAGRGFVVAYPSGHESGGRYTWAPGCAPWQCKPARAPKWLRLAVEVADEDIPGAAAKRVRQVAEPEVVRSALAALPADEYAEWINYGQALKAAYDDDGLALWVEWSRKSEKFKSEADCERKWRTFGYNTSGALVSLGSILWAARRAGWRRSASAADDFAPELWARRVDRTVFALPAPDIQWVIGPCVAAGKVCTLAGAGGSSKSFLAMTLAAHLAQGQDFGPFTIEQPGRTLLLLGEEDNDDLHRRLRVLIKGYDLDEAQIDQRMAAVSVLGEDWSLSDVEHSTGHVTESERLEYLTEQVIASSVRLVVLDPFVFFNGANENDNAQMARQMALLSKLASRSGAAVLVIHHAAKNGAAVGSVADMEQNIVRGASAIANQSRAVMVMARIPRREAVAYGLSETEASRHILLRVVKNNYGPLIEDIVFKVEQGGVLRIAEAVKRLAVVPNARVAALTAQADEVLRLHDDEGLNPAEIAVRLKLSRRTVFRRIQEGREMSDIGDLL